MKKTLFLLLLILTTNLYAEASKLNIVTTIEPVAFFIENITGELAETTVLVPASANPHTYEPTPNQMKKVSTANIYVKVGSGIEFELNWLDKLISLNRKMYICNASENIKLLTMEDKDTNDHGAYDPHIWLAPKNAILITNNILDALESIDPQNKSAYKKNANILISKLEALHKKGEVAFASLRNRSFLVFHPAWQYFSKEFGLHQLSISYHSKQPSAKQIVNIINQAKANNIRVIFTSPQFSKKNAQMIAREIKGKVESIDPLSQDYINNLKKVIQTIKESEINDN